jgi:hypothetical protein
MQVLYPLGRHPLDVLRLSHNAIQSASRDGVFFRYHGRLADTYHFWGGIRAAVICSGSPRSYGRS